MMKLVVCKSSVRDGDRLLFWPKVLLPTIAARLPHLGWGGSTVVTEGRKPIVCKLILTLASYLQLTQTVCAVVILLFNVHLLPLFFRLFTQVHLLIDGSVEGQSITMILDASLLNIQHYKVGIKDKAEQSRERSCALSYILV